MLKALTILLIVPFLYSCQNSATAQEYSPESQLAYAQATKTKHTKRARKQQRKICERLKKIKERLEKRKKRKHNRKGGK